MIYKTYKNGKEIKFEYGDGEHKLGIYRDGELWGQPQGSYYVLALLRDIEKYRNEIIELRGKAHLSCPNCHEDCMGWVSDGIPCSKHWEI